MARKDSALQSEFWPVSVQILQWLYSQKLSYLTFSFSFQIWFYFCVGANRTLIFLHWGYAFVDFLNVCFSVKYLVSSF